MRQKMRRNPIMGFTLIEIAIALLILAIGCVSVLTLFPVGFDAAARSMRLTTATTLAQGLFDDAKVAGFGGVDSMAVTKKTFEAPHESFEYSFVVTRNIDGLNKLKKVDVTIFWPAGASNQKSILLTTYIAKYEP